MPKLTLEQVRELEQKLRAQAAEASQKKARMLTELCWAGVAIGLNTAADQLAQIINEAEIEEQARESVKRSASTHKLLKELGD